MPNLTDLITEKHLEFLGDVEWKHYFSDGAYAGVKKLILDKPYINAGQRVDKWLIDHTNFIGVVDNHIASCILEHHIRVMLGVGELFVGPCGGGLKNIFYIITTIHNRSKSVDGLSYKTEPEALIAAMDALIEGEAQAPKTTE